MTGRQAHDSCKFLDLFQWTGHVKLTHDAEYEANDDYAYIPRPPVGVSYR